MPALRPGILRAYVAAIAILAVLLVRRSHVAGWTPETILAAGLADFLVIGVLSLAYAVLHRWLTPGSVGAKLNQVTHWTIALGLVVIAAAAQILFLKTGEILNPDILAFFLAHSADLTAVAATAVDAETISVGAICLGLLFLAFLHFSPGMLRALQRTALVLPLGLVFAGPLLFPEDAAEQTFALPKNLEDKVLYRGSYRNFFERQFAWNTSDVPGWQRGILTGMSVGQAMGMLQYQTLADTNGSEAAYVSPQFVAAATKRPNVVFVLLESVRYDVLGAYSDNGDSGKSETPFLDHVAGRGWLVEQAYTTIPHTSKALVGIYCGTFSRFETEITEARPDNLPLTCLPHLLRSAGYRSAHFQTAPASFEDRLQFLGNVGFDHRFTQESIANKEWATLGYLGVDDRAMITPAVDWMQAQTAQGSPFFASLLTIATHHPYVSPGNIRPVNDTAEARDAYLKAVRYTDEVVRELFLEMGKRGLLENTLVVITGDHGEAFAEHGQIGHNGVAHEEGIRVPMILYGPSLGQPRRISGLRQQIDLMPTVLDFAGVSYKGTLPGKSLRSTSGGHAELITSCFYQDYCLTHLTDDGRKLLFFYGKRSMEMYDLKNDPLERKNLLGAAMQDEAMQRLGLAVRKKKAFEAVYRPKPNADTHLTVEAAP